MLSFAIFSVFRQILPSPAQEKRRDGNGGTVITSAGGNRSRRRNIRKVFMNKNMKTNKRSGAFDNGVFHTACQTKAIVDERKRHSNLTIERIIRCK